MLRYHIQTIELSAPTPVINISNIPQIYDDLYLVTSLRSDGGGTGFFARLAMTFNNVTTNRNSRVLYGFNNGSTGSETSSTVSWFYTVSTSATVNTYGNNGIYISNYRTSQNKAISIDSTTEHNGTDGIASITAGLWADSSAINSIQIFFNEAGSNFFTNSSVSIYGIKRGSDGKTEVASGGTITTSGGYTIHTFNSSGTFVANRNMDVEYLVVGGGGGGGGYAGGGAGGLLYNSSFNVAANTNYSVVVGGGGAGGPSATGIRASNGSNSVFATATALGGGGGGANGTGADGGSGGGGGWQNSAGGAALQFNSGGATGFGNSGGSGFNNGSSIYNGGGGGGAGGAGTAGSLQPNGGVGRQYSISGSALFYAGGGGGGSIQAGGTGGSGVGGTGATNNGSATAGTANRGGGGGGGRDNTGAAGGSGVVIIRYLTPAS